MFHTVCTPLGINCFFQEIKDITNGSTDASDTTRLPYLLKIAKLLWRGGPLIIFELDRYESTTYATCDVRDAAARGCCFTIYHSCIDFKQINDLSLQLTLYGPYTVSISLKGLASQGMPGTKVTTCVLKCHSKHRLSDNLRNQ